MGLKNKSLLNCFLYLILDKNSCHQGDVVNALRLADKRAIDLVQLREIGVPDKVYLKDAKVIKRLCQQNHILFLINNRVDIAKITDADGLHLGQLDFPLKNAREILGKNKIIGVSCHNLAQAIRAQREGADYISIGPIFRTRTKPELKPVNLKLITIINREIRIPFFVIGGINQSNIKIVFLYGARRVALARAICSDRNIKMASIAIKNQICKFSIKERNDSN